MRVAVLLVAALAAIPVASNAQAPERRPGWWRMEVTVAGATPAPMHQTLHMCTDAGVDQVQSPFGVHQGGRACPNPQVSRTPGGWDIAATCTIGATTIATHGHASGDLGARYHVDLVTHMSPAPLPMLAETRVGIDAAWEGPCPPGEKPGDVETKMNVSPAAP